MSIAYVFSGRLLIINDTYKALYLPDRLLRQDSQYYVRLLPRKYCMERRPLRKDLDEFDLSLRMFKEADQFCVYVVGLMHEERWELLENCVRD